MPTSIYSPFAQYNALHSTSYSGAAGVSVYVPFNSKFWMPGGNGPGPWLMVSADDRDESEPVFVDPLTDWSGAIVDAYYDPTNEIVVGFGDNFFYTPDHGCLFGYDLSGNVVFQVDTSPYSSDVCRAFTSNATAGTTIYCIRRQSSTYNIATINPSTGARTNIHDITGVAVDSRLILDNDGNLWFVRSDGTDGSVIKYDVGADTETTVYSGSSSDRAEPYLIYDPVAHTIGWFANTGGTYGWQWHIHDIAAATTGSPITPSQKAFALMTMTPTTGFQADAGAIVGESYDPTLTPQWGLDVIDSSTFTLIERLPDTGGSGTQTYYAFTHKRYGTIYEHWFVDIIAGEAVILIWERVGVTRNHDAICHFDTITSLVKASTLAGMQVTAVFDSGAFTETVTWAATSATAGEAVGTGWSLSCDGNTGPLDDAVWTFSFTGVGLPLTQLVLNVEPAGCVLDTVRSNAGSTPGSAGGGAFNALSGLEGCWITAAYSKLALKVPYTVGDGYLDLYLIATIDFGGTPPSADFTFSQDHDTVTGLVCPLAFRRITTVNINMRRR